MRISAALADVSLIGIETAPFIYFVEQNPTYIARMRAIFGYVKAHSITVITSALTLTEVLVLPLQTAQTHYVHEYREMLLNTKQITTIGVSTVIAEQAAELRVKYGLKTPDAIHVATAIVTGCGAFLTNDRNLSRVAEISILQLDQLELDN